MIIHITTDATIRTVYSDRLDLKRIGRTIIKRASHVEPSGDGWAADLSPVGGPTLGPFAKRQQALDAEVDWLHRNIASIRIPN